MTLEEIFVATVMHNRKEQRGMTRSDRPTTDPKDLYLMRWMIVGARSSAASSRSASCRSSAVSAYIGGVVCSSARSSILNIFAGHVRRRAGAQATSVLLFVLSLPVSPTQYTAAKVLRQLSSPSGCRGCS